MKFDFYVHGLWMLSAVFFIVGSMIAGNIEWVEGTTGVSFGLSLLIAFVIYLIATMLMISSAINAKNEER